MLRYPTYMAVETIAIALVTEDGQSFEDLGIEERKEGQVIIKCRAAELVGDGAPCEFNKMGSDGYPFCASSTEVMRLREQNTKLRELVRDAWGNGHPDKSCGDCEIIDECNAEIEEARKKGNGRWNTRCLFERRIEDRMRELGIEVTE